jgi:hypothetical protein
MDNSLFIFVAPIVALFFGIIYWIIQDKKNQKLKNILIQEIKNRKATAVYLETRVTRKVSSFAGFSIIWENAELIFTEKSILFFSYSSVFGRRYYKYNKHWYIPLARVPHKLPQSTVIEGIKIKDQNLVVTTQLNASKMTITLKNVVNSEQFEIIKKLLGISFSDYPESLSS